MSSRPVSLSAHRYRTSPRLREVEIIHLAVYSGSTSNFSMLFHFTVPFDFEGEHRELPLASDENHIHPTSPSRRQFEGVFGCGLKFQSPGHLKEPCLNGLVKRAGFHVSHVAHLRRNRTRIGNSA